jgi:hypothetical protein
MISKQQDVKRAGLGPDDLNAAEFPKTDVPGAQDHDPRCDCAEGLNYKFPASAADASRHVDRLAAYFNACFPALGGALGAGGATAGGGA